MIFNGYTYKLLHEDKKKEINYEVKDVDELFNKLFKDGYRYLGTGDFLERAFIREKANYVPDIIVIKREGA